MAKRKKQSEDAALTAAEVWKEYEACRDYLKQELWGDKSLYDRVNENNLYYEGRQWEDFTSTETGVELPVFNICKQIGSAHVAIVASNVLTASYSWEDVPSLQEEQAMTTSQTMGQLPGQVPAQAMGQMPTQEPQTAGELASYLSQVGTGGVSSPLASGTPSNEEMRAVALMLSKYFRTFSNRCNLNHKVKQCVTEAFKNGSGLLYFYWDSNIRNMGASGDIAVEPVEIINLLCGDPTITSLQEQPFLILESRKSLRQVKNMAEKEGIKEDIDLIKADDIDSSYGDNHEIERSGDDQNAKCTVLTRFWKETENGKTRVYVMKCTKDAVVKEKTDTKLTVYPLAYMPYEQKRGTIYAHTPLTEIIPNQRVANLLRYNQLVADSYSAQPTLLYDETRIPDGVTNEIGGQIPVEGQINDVARYLQGQGMAASSENLAQVFMNDTLDISNVNAAVRGDLNPDNTSAIIALRDAAKMPMQLTSANLYMMFEDVARIVSDFILGFYGKRQLRIEEKGESYIVPFDAARYRDYILSVHVDVGESTLWSETATIRTLDNLLVNGQITARQYLERVPDGYVPMKQELINEIRAQEQAALQQAQQQMATQTAAPSPDPGASAPAMDWASVLSGLSDEELTALQGDPSAASELARIAQNQSVGI